MKSVGSYCFYKLFYNCKNISDCSSMTLPAMTLANYCYSNMFYGCTSLTHAPELPAMTLADHCYASMFNLCTSLTQAPALPATTLADNCYSRMFACCYNLTQAPNIKTYTPYLTAFGEMLYAINNNTNEWGQLTTCTWNDLTLTEVESMVLNEYIFGYDGPGLGVRISITCKDGSGTAYFDLGKFSWVFEY